MHHAAVGEARNEPQPQHAFSWPKSGETHLDSALNDYLLA
jgi:hypothetical protein